MKVLTAPVLQKSPSRKLGTGSQCYHYDNSLATTESKSPGRTRGLNTWSRVQAGRGSSQPPPSPTHGRTSTSSFQSPKGSQWVGPGVGKSEDTLPTGDVNKRGGRGPSQQQDCSIRLLTGPVIFVKTTNRCEFPFLRLQNANKKSCFVMLRKLNKATHTKH